MQGIDPVRRRKLSATYKQNLIEVKRPPRVLTVDLEALIEGKIKKIKDNSFIYLSYAYPSSSEFFNAYSLVLVFLL